MKSKGLKPMWLEKLNLLNEQMTHQEIADYLWCHRVTVSLMLKNKYTPWKHLAKIISMSKISSRQEVMYTRIKTLADEYIRQYPEWKDDIVYLINNLEWTEK